MTGHAPAQRHSRTSCDAARRLRGAASIETRVRQYLEHVGQAGATDAEIAAALELPERSTRPRRIALLHHGVVVGTGRTRRTPSGRRAEVWMIAGAGDDLAADVAYVRAIRDYCRARRMPMPDLPAVNRLRLAKGKAEWSEARWHRALFAAAGRGPR